MTISSWLNFAHPAPPGRGSAAGPNFLAPPYYSQHTVFVSLWALFSLINELLIFTDTICHSWWMYLCRIECMKACDCLIQSATANGLPTHLSFYSWTKKICLKRRSRNRLLLSVFKNTTVSTQFARCLLHMHISLRNISVYYFCKKCTCYFWLLKDYGT